MRISPVKHLVFTKYKPQIRRQTFTGSTCDEKLEEFDKMKTQIQNEFKAKGINVELTENNIQIADKILSDKNLCNNETVMNMAACIIFHVKTPEQAKIADKMLSDKKLYNNKDVIAKAGKIIYSSQTPEQAKITDKILSNEKLYNNKNVMDKANRIIFHITSPEKFKIADKIFSNEKLYSNRNIADKAESIISIAETTEQFKLADEILSDETLYYNEYLGWIISQQTFLNAKENLEIIDKMRLYNIKDKKIAADLLTYNIGRFIFDGDVKSAQKTLQTQYKKVMKAPEKYVSGEFDSELKIKSETDRFFKQNAGFLLLMSTIYDKETFNTLLRMRFKKAQAYIRILKNMCYNDTRYIDLLKKLVNSCNVYDKPFLPTQKIQFIDLIQAYKSNNMRFDKIEKMADDNKVDFGALNKDLFENVLKKAGLSDEEIKSIPREKLLSWDIKYIHLLASESDLGNFDDILRVANLETNFIKYIHDVKNGYGEANLKTFKQFQQFNMDYQKWLKPSREIKFTPKDKNAELLAQIANQVTDDMNKLMQTPAKDFLKKQFPKFVKDNSFVIPPKYLKSKASIQKSVENMVNGNLLQVWTRAKEHNNENVLNILTNLKQSLDDISKISDLKFTKTLDLTIKMWDRNPQKDLFQGNYSSCCIGMGKNYSFVMPEYLMNTAYNMIELVDNNSGDTIGNALCYFVKNDYNQLMFVLDNIEINNSFKLSDDAGIKLRDKIAEYAKLVARDVTGKDVEVIMGLSNNDVPVNDLDMLEDRLIFIGKTNGDGSYMDLFSGYVEKPFADWVEFYRLK